MLAIAFLDVHLCTGYQNLQNRKLICLGILQIQDALPLHIQLGLIPLAAAGILEEVYTTGITGSTGAGQGLSSTSHFSWRANNISAYKTLQHQHLNEIGESSSTASENNLNAKNLIHFVPWRGDFTRGIYTSSVTKSVLSLYEVKKIYQDFYANALYTHLSNIYD
jgi:N-acetyl-gamma-glutamyl-phosphate reductase